MPKKTVVSKRMDPAADVQSLGDAWPVRLQRGVLADLKEFADRNGISMQAALRMAAHKGVRVLKGMEKKAA